MDIHIREQHTLSDRSSLVPIMARRAGTGVPDIIILTALSPDSVIFISAEQELVIWQIFPFFR